MVRPGRRADGRPPTSRVTWMCSAPPLGPNPHPNDAGYRTIVAAIAEAVA